MRSCDSVNCKFLAELEVFDGARPEQRRRAATATSPQSPAQLGGIEHNQC